ncbi:MAG: urease accessory protein UreD, partial [Pseudomonadota bacterium]
PICRIEVDLAPDATLLAAEAGVLGRAAMGEVVAEARFEDQWRVRRDGALIYADALRIDGDIGALAGNPAALNGGGAFASLCLIGPTDQVAPLLAPARAAIGDAGGASLVRPGVLAARLVAENGFALRKALIPALAVLRGRALPALWTY